MSRPCGLCPFFPCTSSILEVALDSFAVEFWGRILSIIFNSPFEYDVIQTFVRAHEELLYFICSRTRSPRLWDVNCGNNCNTFDVYFNSSNCDRKGQSYPVEYYLESVEEYSEGKIHMSEPESGKRNVNTVYFVNQARGNTRISRTTEFVCDEWARDCKCLHRFELPA